MERREYVSTRSAADQLGVGLQTIYALIAEGELYAYPHITPGGRIHAWKVSQASIDSYPRRARMSLG